MTKQERALEIIDRLKREYPDAGCTLDYNEAWKLLVNLRLAAQCTDARVNVVVEKLYENILTSSRWPRRMWMILRRSCIRAGWAPARRAISAPA